MNQRERIEELPNLIIKLKDSYEKRNIRYAEYCPNNQFY